jgi:glycosyltransferase involved in cell wall biosynthesis
MEQREAYLVSIIIPCHNYAHFLGEALESALNQSYPSFEVIVVDDGSTDETRAVAGLYPAVRYVYQENRGLSAARNTGLRESRGQYLVFLDADDRLLPGALSLGAGALNAGPELAFVWGYTQLISRDGEPLPTELFLQYADRDHYLWLLHRNYIWNPAAVMYRRAIFESVGGFDTSLNSCEDYELYLRIARDYPVDCHGQIVVEYRMHGENMSRNSEKMLKTVMSVMRAQKEHVSKSKEYREAHQEGIRFKRKIYGRRLLREVYRCARRRHNLRQALRSSWALVRYYPQGLLVLMLRLPKRFHRGARRRRSEL